MSEVEFQTPNLESFDAFCLDLTATQIATISHLNRLITLIRKHMVHLSEQQTRIG